MPSLFLFGISGALYGRWAYLWLGNSPKSHVPSIIIASVLFLTGVQLMLVSYICFLNRINRRLSEDILGYMKSEKKDQAS